MNGIPATPESATRPRRRQRPDKTRIHIHCAMKKCPDRRRSVNQPRASARGTDCGADRSPGGTVLPACDSPSFDGRDRAGAIHPLGHQKCPRRRRSVNQPRASARGTDCGADRSPGGTALLAIPRPSTGATGRERFGTTPADVTLVRRLRGFMWPTARRANQDGLYLSGNGARNLAIRNARAGGAAA
jgi:hypothetical protein